METLHHGTCHCGAVAFDVRIDLSDGVTRCNCTICAKTAWLGKNVKPDAFVLRSGEDALSSYEFGHKVAKRFFCKHCGVQCFGRGHLDVLGGDFVSINVNLLDDVEVGELRVRHWDGRHDNWQGGMRDAPWPALRRSA